MHFGLELKRKQGNGKKSWSLSILAPDLVADQAFDIPREAPKW